MPATTHSAGELVRKAEKVFGSGHWEAEYADICGHDGLLPVLDHDSRRPVKSGRGFILSHHGKHLRVLYEGADSFGAAVSVEPGSRVVTFRRQAPLQYQPLA